MKTNAPRMITWVIAAVLLIIGLVGQLTNTIPLIDKYAFWWAFSGGALSILSSLFKGL